MPLQYGHPPQLRLQSGTVRYVTVQTRTVRNLRPDLGPLISNQEALMLPEAKIWVPNVKSSKGRELDI
jgi:hypothetical protein